MTGSGYEIAHFRSEHEPRVLEVLSDLWAYDRETRARLFRWKYLENPHADGPLGIVALYQGRVIGFRGYFADRFVLEGHDGRVGVLHPGDTCVDPDHRNKGLSVAMGNLAMQYDTSSYRLFMNMSCNKFSLPGYLAMGFQPLTKRIRLLRHGRNPIRWALAAWSKNRKSAPLKNGRIKFGKFGNLVVSDSPLPAEMASIIAAQAHSNEALNLHQDQAFFSWRYRNPVRRYVFYFLLEGSVARGFVVLDLLANGIGAEILDYGERDDRAIREILEYIVKSRNVLALSVFSYGVDDRLRGMLTELGFSAVHSPQTLVRKGSVEDLALPLLIRPVQEAFTQDSFTIGGVDMRKFDSWRLKPICSDGA